MLQRSDHERLVGDLELLGTLFHGFSKKEIRRGEGRRARGSSSKTRLPFIQKYRWDEGEPPGGRTSATYTAGGRFRNIEELARGVIDHRRE